MKGFFPFVVLHLVLLGFDCKNVLGQEMGSNQPCIENMSAEERENFKDVPEGKLIFNTSTGCLNYFHNNAWRNFCEDEKRENPSINFDSKTGKLKYEINGQWYTFSMDKPEESNNENEGIMQSSTEDKVSSSDLPSDCRTKPTRPYAGRDLVSFDVIDLEGNKPLHGVGFWQIIKGEGGHFVDSTVPNTQFIGVQGTTYHLQWTIATQCDTLYDEALVRIRPPCDPEPSQSFAGPDQFKVEIATLSANYPKSGKGNWTIVSGLGGSLSDPTDPNTTFKGRPGETYVLRWIIRNECGLTQDDVIISIKPPCAPEPSLANAGEDQFDIEKCKLKAEYPQNGKGKWRIVSGERGKVFNKDTNYTTFYGKPGQTYVLQWTVSTACGSNSDEVTINFASYCPDEFTDTRDGNKYKSIRLAGQCWMADNLNYRSDEFTSYCYDGYPDFCKQFGALYNWNTVMEGKSKEGIQGICPEGWHLPSDDEWQHLVDSSGYNGAELQLNGGSNFNVPMSGARYTNGKFLNRREYAYFWSSTSKDDKTAWNRYFPLKSISVDHFPTDKNHSFSVRCVKDE